MHECLFYFIPSLTIIYYYIQQSIYKRKVDAAYLTPFPNRCKVRSGFELNTYLESVKSEKNRYFGNTYFFGSSWSQCLNVKTSCTNKLSNEYIDMADYYTDVESIMNKWCNHIPGNVYRSHAKQSGFDPRSSSDDGDELNLLKRELSLYEQHTKKYGNKKMNNNANHNNGPEAKRLRRPEANDIGGSGLETNLLLNVGNKEGGLETWECMHLEQWYRNGMRIINTNARDMTLCEIAAELVKKAKGAELNVNDTMQIDRHIIMKMAEVHDWYCKRHYKEEMTTGTRTNSKTDGSKLQDSKKAQKNSNQDTRSLDCQSEDVSIYSI